MIIACIVKRVLYNTGSDIIAVPSEEKSFAVIDQLIAAVPKASEGKKLLDEIIDLCGDPPLGTGLQNLRHCIMWTKEKYDSEPDHKKVILL